MLICLSYPRFYFLIDSSAPDCGYTQIKWRKSTFLKCHKPQLVFQIAESGMESWKTKLKEAQETIKLKRREAKANVERQSKAQRAISLCNLRVRKVSSVHRQFCFSF